MATSALPSIGFSGAGFLGCYHVGVASCLQRQGWLGLDDSANHRTTTIQPTTIKPLVPLLTGVSAGSMIAAATAAGVAPEPDGMDVVLTAARRTRELSKKSLLPTFDALTPGYSLIDAVEGTFREAIVKALGGTLPSKSQQQNRDLSDHDYTLESLYDIDPQLFQRRFPMGSLRIGLTDKRALLSSFPPPSPLSALPTAYRYVDSYRNVEDVVAACMLSSYIPGVTGPLLKDNKLLEAFNIGGSEKDEEAGNDAMKRAGRQLREMTRLGLVKDGKTGLPSAQQSETEIERSSQDQDDDSTQYWDGGIADVFPTFDDNTIIVSPISGVYSNPTICPSMQQPNEVENNSSVSYLLRSYVPSLPATFRHCSKSSLGLNMENAKAVKDMILSSDDEQLYQRFKEGYDDTTRFLNERDLTRVFRG